MLVRPQMSKNFIFLPPMTGATTSQVMLLQVRMQHAMKRRDGLKREPWQARCALREGPSSQVGVQMMWWGSPDCMQMRRMTRTRRRSRRQRL